MVNAPTRPTAEIARLGREIYELNIRLEVEADHHGEVVDIDVDTGDWAIGDDVIAAAADLRKKCPEAVNVLSERIGYPALRNFGGGAPCGRHRVIEGVVNGDYEARPWYSSLARKV